MKSWVILAAWLAFCVTQTSVVQGLPQVGVPGQPLPNQPTRQPETSIVPEVTESEAAEVTTVRPGQLNELDEDEADAEGITTTFNPDSGLDPHGDTNVTTTTMATTSSPSNTTTSSNTTESTTPMTTPSSTTSTTTTTTVAPTNGTTTPVVPVTVTMPSPDENRGFEGWSFFGGIVLTLVVFAIGFVGFKYYKIRGSAHGGNYNRF